MSVESSQHGRASGQPSPEALRVYVDYQARLESGEDLTLESLCVEHAALADEIRDLHEDWALVEELLDEAARGEPAAIGLAESGVEATDRTVAVELDPAALRPPLPAVEAEHRFQDLEPIARGGMGVVWRVWDHRLRRHLAMKVMSEDADEEGAARARKRARFIEEAQVAAQLDHPGVAPVHEIGVDERGRVYFTMKLVKGQTLREIVDALHAGDEEWPLPRVLHVILRVCDAMAYAHDKGVLHRDLKPSNIMVGRFGEVYVMDWGLARVRGRAADAPEPAVERGAAEGLDVDPARCTVDGDVIGTPVYMSPEQAASRRQDVGPATDVYSVGAMLYHLLAGRAPYLDVDGETKSHVILQRVRKGSPRSIHERAPGMPIELRHITEKAMARAPVDRYPSMLELAADLRAYLEGRVVSASQRGVADALRKWVLRNRLLAAAFVAVLLAVGGGISTGLVYARKSEVEAIVARLSALGKLDELRARADALWPPRAENVEPYEAWLREAEALVAALDVLPDGPGYRERLLRLRGRALDPRAEDTARSIAAHPEAWSLGDAERKLAAWRRALRVRQGLEEPEPAVLEDTGGSAETLALTALPLVHKNRYVFGREAEGWALARRALDVAKDDHERARASYVLAWARSAMGLDAEALQACEAAIGYAEGADRDLTEQRKMLQDRLLVDWERAVANLEASCDALRDDVHRRRVWRFSEPRDQVEHDHLAQLVEELQAFSDDASGLLSGISAVHGWGVRRRLDFARGVCQGALAGDEASQLWNEAIRAIADVEAHPEYGGMTLSPQPGLLPLGPDPASGLWEFAHLQSGLPALRDEDGRLITTEETGLVLVLVPAGSFVRGRANGTVDQFEQRVELDPFFLSKFEMTQAQWKRSTGSNPSRYGTGFRSGPSQITLAHPVEHVSWEDCGRVLEWLGLSFPSEAQWEYAARAGATGEWWTGDEPESLATAANLLDAAARGSSLPRDLRYEEWRDGYVRHAPVGSFAPNDFGLHDVHGNVAEWCADGYQSLRRWGPVTRNPVADVDAGRWRSRLSRVVRGGGYESTATMARLSRAGRSAPDYRGPNVGLRPARRIEP